MKKFNIKSLENTFDKIDNIQINIAKDENNIITKTYKKCNNKAIETILSVLIMCFEQDYKNAAGEYYFNSLNESIKYKLIFMIHFLSSIYKK